MVTKAHILQWLERLAALYAENKEYLTELDSAIGDADHGVNLARGFREVNNKIPDMQEKDIANALKSTGMTLISKVGGASGPLYGTFFMRAAGPAADKDALSAAAPAEVTSTNR